MADTFTTNLNLTKPQIGGDTDSWGTLLNADFDTIDAIFAGAGTGTSVGLNVGIGKTLAVTGTANITGGGSLGGTFTGTPTFSGALTFSGTPIFSTGASLTGTFTGSPTLSGNPSFTGTPNFTNSFAIGTLSAWGGGKAIQLGTVSSLWSDASSTTAISSNTYWNGTGWNYTTTASAVQYYQTTQTHYWRTAVSGSAGTSIGSWLTQMSLDSAGNLVVAGSITAPKGVGGTPAFSAYMSTNQTLTSGVSTKIAFDTKSFDTANCYNTSNYRFTPNVAGYYQIVSQVAFSGAGGAVTGQITNQIYKNGGGNVYQLNRAYATSDYPSSNSSILLYMNGTTDYIEVYVVQTATASGQIQGGLQFSAFSAVLVRSA